jgi:hypothetical protein
MWRLFSSNVCTCPASQIWNGNGCSSLSTQGQYCLTNVQCDNSALLICNNTQQCYSNLICINNYCQCPLINLMGFVIIYHYQ